MHDEPADLDRTLLAGALERHWGIGGARLTYLPVGFGSHHWTAAGGRGRWFVTADDLRNGRDPDDAFASLGRAFRTAAALRDAGLEFVVAPIPSRDGAVLRRLGPRYAIRVEPFVDGWAGADGEFAVPGERRSVAELVGRMHAASASVPPGLTAREDFALPHREPLEEALAALGEPWAGGPFAEPARALLHTHAAAVRDRLLAHDRLADRVRAAADTWVVTHGEPHSANVMRTTGGGLRLVDWDTALVAPRERDLWMVLDAALAGWNEYRAAAGPARLDEAAAGLYRERWALAEIGEYVALFRLPHAETADTRAAWNELGAYLA